MFVKYKEHCSNTIKFYKPTLIHNTGEIVNVPFMTPLTISGFCSFCNIPTQTFYDYCSEASKEYNQLLIDTAIRIRTEIESYLDEGSVTGAFNPTYTAKLRGLKDTVETNINTHGHDIKIEISGLNGSLADNNEE